MSDSNTLLNEAMVCHQQGNLFDADRLYSQAIKLDPENSQALRLHGILARENGDLEKSLQLLTQAAEVDPNDPEPLGEIALAQMAAGEFPDADASLRAALQIAPDYMKGWSNLGALLQHRGHLQESIACYRQVLSKEKENVEIRCNLAKALADAGDGEQALTDCDIALKQSARHPYALATLGAVLIDLDRYADAREILEEATRLDAGDDMALVNLALACLQLDDLGAATTSLRNATGQNPYNARAVADLVNCLTAGGEQSEALQLCEDFLHRHPGERMVVGAYALALHNAGRNTEAANLTDCNKLVQLHTLPIPGGYSRLEDFNGVIADLIRNHPSLIRNPVSKSTIGEQTGELDPATCPALAALETSLNEVISDAAYQYRAAKLGTHPVMLPAADKWKLRIWGTKLHQGGRQTPHMHPSAWLSGVFYPHLPVDMDSADPESGWLEFGRPPKRYYRPTEPVISRFEPTAGSLFIFPSWFWHQTIPFESAGDRISIGFDVMPQTALQML